MQAIIELSGTSTIAKIRSKLLCKCKLQDTCKPINYILQLDMYYNDYDYLFYSNPCKSSIMDENMQIPPTFRSAYINTFIIQVQGSIC